MLSNIISFVASKFADKALNAGIDAVLEDDSGGGVTVTPPNFDAARLLASSPAGVVTPIDAVENSYEEKRLIEYTQSRPVVSKIEV
jgi:hypothetical protein